jgi:hypothetical chaperone protein
MPSAVFYDMDDENKVYFGKQAIKAYENMENGRLLRAFKSILGSSLIDDTTKIHKKQIPFTKIIEDYLKNIKDIAEKEIGHSLDSVVLGRPIYFVDGNEKKDKEAEDTLKQIAKNIGFKNVEMQYESIAAALKYEQFLTSQEIVLIVDIGGGTTDISIVRLSPKLAKNFDRKDDCFSNAGVHIGGTNFDAKLNLYKVMPLLGYQQTLKNGLNISNYLYHDIANWNRIYKVYKREFLQKVISFEKEVIDYKSFDRLLSLIHKEAAFNVSSLVESAKIDLSNKDNVIKNADFLEKGLSINFTREDLECYISDYLNEIEKVIMKCIKNAGLKKENIQQVFLTGGSSGMKVIQDFIKDIFKDKANINNSDTLSSVAIGLTLDAKRKFDKV